MENMENYTVAREKDFGKLQLIHKIYTEQEIEKFRKKAAGIYYHVYYHYEGVEEYWHLCSNSYDNDSFFLDIPAEDYVIEDGELAGFYPYHGCEKMNKNIIELLSCQGDTGILWLQRDIPKGRENFFQVYKEKHSVRGKILLRETMETVWNFIDMPS